MIAGLQEEARQHKGSRSTHRRKKPSKSDYTATENFLANCVSFIAAGEKKEIKSNRPKRRPQRRPKGELTAEEKEKRRERREKQKKEKSDPNVIYRRTSSAQAKALRNISAVRWDQLFPEISDSEREDSNILNELSSTSGGTTLTEEQKKRLSRLSVKLTNMRWQDTYGCSEGDNDNTAETVRSNSLSDKEDGSVNEEKNDEADNPDNAQEVGLDSNSLDLDSDDAKEEKMVKMLLRDCLSSGSTNESSFAQKTRRKSSVLIIKNDGSLKRLELGIDDELDEMDDALIVDFGRAVESDVESDLDTDLDD